MSNAATLFEKSVSGHRGVSLPTPGVPFSDPTAEIPAHLLRKAPAELPELNELEVMRHFINLSHKNMAIDVNFYPLGSCTMKYNPKVNEKAAALPGFAELHPYQPFSQTQGALALLWGLKSALSEIVGLPGCSLQPAAGAHGELTGMMMIKAYHAHHGQTHRTKVLVPDSAHGTNPSSARMCGYEVVTLRSDARGQVDLEHLKELLAAHGEHTAALMMTNPNTLGIFEEQILEISERVHAAGGLLYYDGANLNAIMGQARPGDMGFDVVHLNLHKTFSTPHGGGGPGAGPVLVCDLLEPFLPRPVIIQLGEDRFGLDEERPLSVGRVRSFYGNFGVLVRAYTYIRAMGAEGLKQASQDAVLNANYLRAQLKQYFELPHDDAPCMHEFVLSAQQTKKEHGVNALSIGKRLIDFGFHPPTVYFPLIVPEAMMIEPTETETRETLDRFIAAMTQIATEIQESPDFVNQAPHEAEIRRVDEAAANRKPAVNWFRQEHSA
ncbi:MAG: aminomethyl-transferring glycine dehydrogenase subunit GcvPB [Candidatus Sericytochromatia bacterium]|nr:aminomethyl-transferring glycine dehydrogenase subunit GcvPB [Candidatus Sericytochromatia bacterium]